MLHLSFVLAVALGGTVSPVQKVIELLQELKVKVTDELTHEGELMEEYTKWCSEEANSREDAITHAERSVRELSATVEDATAELGALKAETSDIAAQISVTEGDLSKAKGIRAGEKGTFDASEKELMETVDTLERAVVILKRAQTTAVASSFMQKGAKGAPPQTADAAVQAVLPALESIISASWVTSQERDAVQGLIQSAQQDKDQDEDLSLQPQASVAAYEGHGSSIIEVLEGLQQKAEQALTDARKTEMNSRHSSEMLSQGLNDELEQFNHRMEQTQETHTEVEEGMHQANGELAVVKRGLAEDTEVLAETKSACTQKAGEWEERQKSAEEEMAAIEKAREILMQAPGMSMLMQGKMGQVPSSDDPVTARKRNAAATLLTSLSQKYSLYSLSQLAISAQSDPFEKVRGMIEGLVERLLAEASEEADAKGFCDSEMAKSDAKKDDLVGKVEKHRVRVEKAVAAQSILKQQAASLQNEIAELDSANAAATSIRTEEKAEFEKSSAENKASAAAIADAMQVLSEYYNQSGPSFLQLWKAVANSNLKQPALGGSKTDVASTILSMLEVAESDFTRLVAEAESIEHQAESAYAKLTQDSAVLRAAKIAEVNGKAAELKSFELQELNYKGDYAATNKELDAVLAYLDELKPQCEVKVQSFSERTARREAEIAGLKEALEILEAS